MALARRRKNDRSVGLAFQGSREPWGRFPPRVRPLWGSLTAGRCSIGGNPLGSPGDACRNAVAQARPAARAVDAGRVSVPQAFDVWPSALRIAAQRVARFDPSHTRTSLPP